MSITAARLQAEVGADTSGFDRGMAHADSTIRKAPGKWSTALKMVPARLGLAAGVIVRGLSGAINAGMKSLTEEGVVVAQTNAVIRSTKHAANISAAAIRDLSNAIEDKTTIDDKQVQAGANMLLTFTNIKNAAGAGNDIFNQSVSVLADLSTAMGTDMKSAAVQLGKALNDPLKGVTALQRVGVTFDATQKKQIANFMKAGKVAEAQKIILRELNKEFGGSGAAFAATDAGKAAKFQDAIEGIQQSLTRSLLPAITRIRENLTDFLSDPTTMSQASELGDTIAGIFSRDNLRTAASVMKTAAGAIGTTIKLFASLPKEVQALAIGAIGLKKLTGIGITDIAKASGGIIKMIFERGASPANPLFVADVAGGVKGGSPVAGGPSGKFLAGTALSAAALVAAEVTVWNDHILPGLQAQADQNNANATNFLKTGSLADLRQSLSGLEEMPGKLGPLEKGLYELNASGVKTHTESLEAAIRAEIASRVNATAPRQYGEHAAVPALAIDRTLTPSLRSMNANLSQLRSLQARFNATGDTKSAAKIGAAIHTIQAAIKTQKPPTVKTDTTVHTTFVVSGRVIASAIERFASGSGYKGGAR